MSDIAANIISLREKIPPSVKLVAISKTKTVTKILEAYRTGHRIFGENRVQELLSKKDQLPADIEWHFVGHLQSNKVKQIVSFISMIHSVDSFRLLKTIDSEAEKAGTIVSCLLQFHIAAETTKFGFTITEAIEMIESTGFSTFNSVRICGVMGMATFTDNMEQIRQEFRNLAGYFRLLKDRYFKQKPGFREISMGMSGDYMTAIEEGSTVVRIGSVIFGERGR